MSTLKIKGVLKIDVAEIEIVPGKSTYLVGGNEAGKSSILESAVAAYMPRALPPDTTKVDFAERMVNDAYKNGAITLYAPGIIRKIEYPECDIKTISGTQSPKVDDISLGIVRLHDLDPNKRGEFLATVSKSKLTEKRLKEELEGLNLDDDKRKRLIELAMGSSPRTAQEVAKNFATEMKGQFLQATNIKWGINQGVTFKPAGYTDDLAKLCLADIQKEVDKATEELNEALMKAGEYRAAGDKDALALEVEEWAKKVNEYEGRKATGLVLIEKLKSQNGLVECASCGIKGRVENGKLTEAKVEPVTETISLVEAEQHLKTVNAGLGNAQMGLGVAKANFDKAEGKGEPIALDTYRQKSALANQRYKALEAKIKGTEIHKKLVDMLKAADIVSPEGVAKTVLLRGLDDLNKKMQRLSNVAQWPTVQIDNNLNLTYGGRPYHRIGLSMSARWRADAIFQVMAAMVQGSDIILMDYADILDTPAREGLLDLLLDSKVTALVAMTTDPDTFPDLEGLGLGYVYTVKNGIAAPLREKVSA